MTQPPRLLRACLDRTTFQLTVYMLPAADGCGSFVRYILYGRDNIINPFQQLATGTNPAMTSMSATLPNLKRWQLYVVARYACNGADTLISDTIFIDDTPPALLNLDSASVDMTTQRVIAGWQQAPEADVMGYSVFKVDASTGNNILISDTQSNSYDFLTSTFNSNNPNNRVAIAVFDSCRNGGIICNYHSPACLSFTWNNNNNYRCDKKFRFSWTPYVGWVADHYSIWYKSPLTGNWVYDGDVPGATTNYTFDIPVLGQPYSFFVRAHRNAGTGPSSTSNIIQVTLLSHPKPSTNTIGHASVITDNTIEVTGTWTKPGPGYTAKLESSIDGSTWNTAAVLNPASDQFRIKLSPVTANQTSYGYRMMVYNPCGEPVDTSEVHFTMLLVRSGLQLTWNDYTPYQLQDQRLVQRSIQSSTWNNTPASTGGFILADTVKPECYRVVSYQITAGNHSDTSWSNEICLRAKDTTLIPTGFNPDGPNKRFKIVNPNITAGQASMAIYDRWGGKVWEGDALEGWDGEIQGIPAITGIYVYQVRVFRTEKRELFNGTLMLLR